MKESLTYKDAGVNIDTANRLVERIKSIAKTSFRPEVLTDIGGFSGLFSLDTRKYKNPVLTSSTDGVGTKLKIAFMMNRHNTIGIDLVAMSVNDILAQGAEPLFFLDYLSTSKVDLKIQEDVITGITAGCREAGCALIGGEIAEMPSFYKEGEYDLAGFAVGAVDQDKIINGSKVKSGDKIVGIASSGVHSNGYSLVRKIVFEKLSLNLDETIEAFGRTLGEELLEPTKIYVKPVLDIVSKFHVHGISHITGGGLLENIPRILPDNCRAVIHKGSWEIHPVFTFLQEKGNITESEMFRTFNSGIGMVVIVTEEETDEVVSRLNSMNCKSCLIGEITERKKENAAIIFI